MIFQYFMVLYTWTDLEQRVIFDRMLIPFAVIGLISVPLLDRVLTDHLMAAAVGGIVFLVLAIIMLATGKRKKGDFFAYGPYFTISALLFTLL